MTVGKIFYFDQPGGENTAAVVEAVRERRAELGIEHGCRGAGGTKSGGTPA